LGLQTLENQKCVFCHCLPFRFVILDVRYHFIVMCVCHLFVMLLSFWVEKKQKSLKNDSQSGKCKKNDSQSGKGNKKIQKNDSTKQELQKKLKT